MSRRRKRNVDETIRHDVETKDKESYSGISYIVDDSVLDELGVSAYRANAKEDGSPKQHELHMIPAAEEDSSRYGLKLFIHYGVGVNNATVLCPREMVNVFKEYGIDVPDEIKDAKCPVCEKEEKIRAKAVALKQRGANVDSYWDVIKSLRPYNGSYKNPRPKRYLMWTRDASSEEAENEGTKFYLTPTSVMEDGILEKTMTRHGEVIDLADPDDGYVFIFKRSGKGQNDTEYKAFDVDKRGFAIPDEWLDVPRYKDILKFFSYDEIQSFMTEVEIDEDELDNEVDDSDVDKSLEDQLGDMYENTGNDESVDDESVDGLRESFRNRRRRRRKVEETTDDVETEEDDIPI